MSDLETEAFILDVVSKKVLDEFYKGPKQLQAQDKIAIDNCLLIMDLVWKEYLEDDLGFLAE